MLSPSGARSCQIGGRSGNTSISDDGRFLANPNPAAPVRRNTGIIDDGESSERYLVRCAWCERIKVGDGFLTVDPALARDVADHERTSHGICPDCFRRVTDRAAAARRARAHAA